MMKVLYVAPIRDMSGWAYASIDSILALDAAGVDVVPRCVRFNHGTKPKLPERLLELEQKSSRGCDIVIQETIPFTMRYDSHFAKNIGYYFVETSNFASSDWPFHINTMDEAWVVCNHNKQASLDSGINIPINVVNCATDVTKYQKTYKKLKIRDELSDRFIFYTIGENTRRKNLLAVVQAFHLAFEPHEPVELVIKTSMRSMSAEDTKIRFSQDLQLIKESLNLYRSVDHYKKEILITEYWSEEDILRLHDSCDCFVLPSFGEGWGVPAFDAMGFGKTPIVTNYSAYKDFMSDEYGWMVDGYMAPVIGMQNVHGFLYTARSQWYAADLNHLVKCMREAYDNRELREKKAIAGRKRAYDFSYEKIGNKMKEVLSGSIR